MFFSHILNFLPYLLATGSKKQLGLALCCLIVFLGSSQAVEAVRCTEPSEVTVIVRDAEKEFIPNVRFTIYEQLIDVDDNKTIGKSIGGSTINPYIGSGTAKVYADTEVKYYVLKVDNPSISSQPFWFLEAMYLTCGKNTTVTKYLGSLKVTVTDSQGQLAKNTKFSVSKQTADALGNPMIDTKLATFNTDDAGQAEVYVPSHNNQLDPFDYYALEFINSTGKTFYRYYLNALEKAIKPVTYVFSDLLLTLKDENTGDIVPNAKLILYEQKIGLGGAMEPGKSLYTFSTNDLGQAIVQYPAGTYLLQYRHADGSVTNFENVTIVDQLRTTQTFWLNAKSKDAGQCKIKAGLQLSFRDAGNQIINDLNYTLYEQAYDNDDRAIHGAKVVNGTVNSAGLAENKFIPSPAKRYILTVCDEISKFGCFEFTDISLSCSENIFFERQLNQVNVIFRDTNRKLKIGQTFRIYSRTTDVDGKSIVDVLKGYGSFKEPNEGVITLYLSPTDLFGSQMGYTIKATSEAGLELAYDFTVGSGLTNLEFMMQPDKLIRLSQTSSSSSGSLASRVVGRILLQVEAHGEAWYVNPADGRRYYLGYPENAFAVMKNLSIGVSNDNLAKIPVNLEVLPTGPDSDNDGLIDVFEQGLLTNWQSGDSDSDSYSDWQELQNGYNPRGSGRLSYNNSFAQSQKGKILLQVEGHGEAWYINPVNAQRYYLSRPKDAYTIMRQLGLGITNDDLNKIPVGQVAL